MLKTVEKDTKASRMSVVSDAYRLGPIFRDALPPVFVIHPSRIESLSSAKRPYSSH